MSMKLLYIINVNGATVLADVAARVGAVATKKKRHHQSVHSSIPQLPGICQFPPVAVSLLETKDG